MWELEQALFEKGIAVIAGVDEAGRGPLAGPVVAAAVIVPRGFSFAAKIDDSKKLTPLQRQKACAEIKANCAFAFSVVDERVIDADNILNATLSAMAQSVSKLCPSPQWVLVDGNIFPDIPFPGTAIIGGDAKSISIACASIVAKVTRDDIMVAYDSQYPEYGFAGHKGYGTKSHCAAILKHGPCVIHRKTFQPVKDIISSRLI